eukprot:3725780-Alexandrium_andersonii.AAC.1
MFPAIFGSIDLPGFWSKVDKSDPKLALMSDIVQEPGWEQSTIPYVLHGDGASFTKKGEQS